VRLFFSVQLPTAAREHLVRVQRTIQEEFLSPVAWTPADRMHLTAKFLGEVPEDRVPEVIAAASAAELGAPFTLQIDSLLVLPPRGRLNVIAAGINLGRERLSELATVLDRTCERLGFERERRAFLPHITLARARGQLDAGAVRADLAEGVILRASRPGPKVVVGSVVLTRSERGPAGPTYTPLVTLPLPAENR